MSNDFNCPDSVYTAMQAAGPAGPSTLYLVRKLGPGRVQWAGSPAAGNANPGVDDTPTTWALDGVRATQRDLRRALTEHMERRAAS
ncbi:MAG: hypothetical protein RIA64_01330 [Rhodospirillales bacterium]